MSVIACNDGTQAANWCPATTDDMLNAVVGLLPHGVAWDAASQPNTTQNNFWRAISDIALYVNQRICAFDNELFCDYAKESLDQWDVEYALGELCDPYGFNLCAKVTALGATTCPGFVEVALDNGWVVTCAALTTPTVGCFQIGCDQFGPSPQLAGVISAGPCAYSHVVDHPFPAYWAGTAARHGAASLTGCPVPGSNLGYGPNFAIGEPACLPTGFYALPGNIVTAGLGACQIGVQSFFFGDLAQMPSPAANEPSDSTGHWRFGYGNSFYWSVTVDMPRSIALQNTLEQQRKARAIAQGTNYYTGTPSNLGNFQVGCTNLCSDNLNFVLCFLDTIKPAHTTLFTTLIQN